MTSSEMHAPTERPNMDDVAARHLEDARRFLCMKCEQYLASECGVAELANAVDEVVQIENAMGVGGDDFR